MIPGERQVGTQFSEIEYLHRQRYRIAAEIIDMHGADRHGCGIADLGCGVGYGSKIISDRFPWSIIYAIDKCPEAIAYATEHWYATSINYLVSDIDHIRTLIGEKCRTFVALEVLEHLEKGQMLGIMDWVIRNSDLFVYSIPIGSDSPFHKQKFTTGDVLKMSLDAAGAAGKHVLDRILQDERYYLISIG